MTPTYNPRVSIQKYKRCFTNVQTTPPTNLTVAIENSKKLNSTCGSWSETQSKRDSDGQAPFILEPWAVIGWWGMGGGGDQWAEPMQKLNLHRWQPSSSSSSSSAPGRETGPLALWPFDPLTLWPRPRCSYHYLQYNKLKEIYFFYECLPPEFTFT